MNNKGIPFGGSGLFYLQKEILVYINAVFYRVQRYGRSTAWKADYMKLFSSVF